MNLPLTAALALAALAAGAQASDSDSGTFVVPSPHGGYNVIQGGGKPASIALFGFHNVSQGGGKPASIPFFGSFGFTPQVIAQSHEKPKYILRPAGMVDDGHGSKHMIYKKIYFATAEEAEAARLQQ